jgi:polyisoprenyl-teichoic acid--peptidoglycan teichoic acid transferase
VAWRTDRAAYWISNTLLQTLSEDQMMAIARSMRSL